MEITEKSGLKLFKILTEFKEDSLKIDGWSERCIKSIDQKSISCEFDREADSFILKYIPLFGAVACAHYLGLTAKICLKRFKELSGTERISKEDGDIRNSLSSLLANKESYQEACNFINVSMPEAAYILGLIWADGSVQLKQRKQGAFSAITRIHLVSEDFIEIKDSLEKTANWSVCSKDNSQYRWKHSSQAYLCNKILGLFLSEVGYASKSSLSACSILSRIPNHLQKYWFRGLFDGDGGYMFSGYNISIASSYEQDWLYMEKICKELNILNFSSTKNENKKGHKSSVFKIAGREDSLKFLNYIYEGKEEDKIGLSRKYSSYLDYRDNIDGIVNLNKLQFEVRKWMQRAKQEVPNRPKTPSNKVAALRYELIREELEEFKQALGWNGENFDTSNCDLVECYDALLDLMYVTFGGFVSLGLNFEPGWKEVCKSNNSKFAPGFSFREDGKLLKSPLYIPVALKPIVDQQIENGQFYSKKKSKNNFKGEF